MLNMFSRAFTAPTFRGFWRYWNPWYGYALLYGCYLPWRRVAPKSACFVATFAVSGFLFHDLVAWTVIGVAAPVVTVAFVLIAFSCLLSERVGVTLRSLSSSARVVSHLGVILVAFVLSIGLSYAFEHHAG
jgi:hypothetical protein